MVLQGIWTFEGITSRLLALALLISSRFFPLHEAKGSMALANGIKINRSLRSLNLKWSSTWRVGSDDKLT